MKDPDSILPPAWDGLAAALLCEAWRVTSSHEEAFALAARVQDEMRSTPLTSGSVLHVLDLIEQYATDPPEETS